jgi:sulfopyruvate decarboxylase TPP-binding subunit
VIACGTVNSVRKLFSVFQRNNAVPQSIGAIIQSRGFSFEQLETQLAMVEILLDIAERRALPVPSNGLAVTMPSSVNAICRVPRKPNADLR